MKFSDAFEEVSRGVRKFKKKEYLPEGKHPIIDQGKSSVAGYTNEEDGLFDDIPVVVFGDHTRCTKYVDEPFFAGADGVKILKPRLSNNVRYWYHALCAAPIANLGYSRHFKLLKERTFACHSVEEQAEIVEVLDSVAVLVLLQRSYLSKLDELVKSRFLEMFGDPAENSMGWPCERLEDLGDLKNGVNFKAADSGCEIKCLGVGDFKNRYAISDMDLISTVTLNGEPTEKQILRDGDIVFVRSNGNKQLVGRCIAVFPGNSRVTFSGFCIRFRSESDRLLLDYMLGCLKSDSMRKAMTGRGANIQNLNQGILSKVEMPIPPLASQREFADFARQVDKSGFAARPCEPEQKTHDGADFVHWSSQCKGLPVLFRLT